MSTINIPLVRLRRIFACLLFVSVISIISVSAEADFANADSTDALNPLSYEIDPKTHEVMICGCDTSAKGNIKIPAFIKGCPVTSVAIWAFWDCRDITGICFPDSVTYLSGQEFNDCRKLRNITMPFHAVQDIFYRDNIWFPSCNGLRSVCFTNAESDALPSKICVLYALDSENPQFDIFVKLPLPQFRRAVYIKISIVLRILFIPAFSAAVLYLIMKKRKDESDEENRICLHRKHLPQSHGGGHFSCAPAGERHR